MSQLLRTWLIRTRLSDLAIAAVNYYKGGEDSGDNRGIISSNTNVYFECIF